MRVTIGELLGKFTAKQGQKIEESLTKSGSDESAGERVIQADDELVSVVDVVRKPKKNS